MVLPSKMEVSIILSTYGDDKRDLSHYDPCGSQETLVTDSHVAMWSGRIPECLRQIRPWRRAFSRNESTHTILFEEPLYHQENASDYFAPTMQS